MVRQNKTRHGRQNQMKLGKNRTPGKTNQGCTWKEKQDETWLKRGKIV